MNQLAAFCVFVVAVWGCIIWALSSCVQFTFHFLFGIDAALWKCILLGFIPVAGQVINLGSLAIWLLFS